jgi:NAD+ synthase (glutamine-hydrolysing)
VGITMPGFGTTDRTYNNALTLMQTLGITIKEISIREACIQHFKDIGHNMKNHDVTYENAQARERTQILMDVANQMNGFVVGTGDLSELALGWATYNADHMSNYGVNCSIPKTLVRYLVSWVAHTSIDAAAKETLLDIINTPISPELIPADKDGNIQQKTEDLVGPYELHDFYLYHFVRLGFSPQKIFYLACHAFIQQDNSQLNAAFADKGTTILKGMSVGKYDEQTIQKWLTTFCRRFFTQQFKRSCLPDGPKVGSVSLSPRGDWRMPSDADNTAWVKSLDN